MKSLLENINKTIADFQKDADENVGKGNKAAGVRARKASLELEKLFKEYRKKSLESVK